MSVESTACPSPSELVSTSVVRARAGGPSYVVVSFDPRVKSVAYKVSPTMADADPVDNLQQTGELYERFRGNGHVFTFPVEKKKMLYFIEVKMDVDAGSWSHEDVVITWLLDPFKRRQVSRDEVAPNAAEAPPAAAKAVKATKK